MKLYNVGETVMKYYTNGHQFSLYDKNGQEVFNGYDVFNIFHSKWSKFYFKCEEVYESGKLILLYGSAWEQLNAYWTVYVRMNWDNKYYNIIEALKMKYNPIENYDNIEKSIDTSQEGKLSVTHNTNTTTTVGNPVNYKTNHYTTTYDDSSTGRLESYDESFVGGSQTTYTTTNTDGLSNTDETSHTTTELQFDVLDTSQGEIPKWTADKIDSHTLRRHGNIGVTTTQKMIEEEIELRSKDIILKYLTEFANRYFIYIDNGECEEIEVM